MSPEKTKPKEKKKAKKTSRLFSTKTFKTGFIKVAKFLLWLLWDFSGLRYIYSKIRPPLESKKPERKPATFFLWALGIYTALFGIASQRYENRVDIIENRANTIFTQLAIPAMQKKALSRIARTQNMPCPKKPYILKPGTVFASLVGNEDRYDIIVEHLKETLEDWQEELVGVNLRYARLQGVDLEWADLKGAWLIDADLKNAVLNYADMEGAYLYKANLKNAWLLGADLKNAWLARADLTCANLRGADLKGAWLIDADLRGASLSWSDLMGAWLSESDLSGASLSKVNLQGASLYKTDLKGAWLEDVDIEGAKGLTEEQLSQAFTLYKVKGLDPALEKKLKARKPKLFEKADFSEFLNARDFLLTEIKQKKAAVEKEKTEGKK
ncbi:MAG: pentapeptide repeat-containing protein [Candidatus Aminicenantes bacterium]|nr:pentapeptide repeat-containing protein [Candidatus Aminicenantes bacterium]